MLACNLERVETGMPHVPSGREKVDRSVVARFSLSMSGLPNTACMRDNERIANINEVCMAAMR